MSRFVLRREDVRPHVSSKWTWGGLEFKATRWEDREHPRDRHGRFAEKPGGALAVGSAPSTAPAGPKDKLGRAIQPGAHVTLQGLDATVLKVNGERVQVQWDRNGKKSTRDARELTVFKLPDGSRPGGDGLPAPTPARDLKPGDRIFSNSRDGYIVTGPPRSADFGDYLLIPFKDLDGKPGELTLSPDDLQIVYPRGLELPGETTRREAAAAKPSTLKVGEKFSFGMPGMDQPVYTVESVSAPRQVTNKWIDDRGRDRSHTFMAVDLVVRTADGDQVSGTFEDDKGARINHAPKPVQGPPFVPAKVVKVGDVLADPENRGEGNLTVTAITGDPQMSTSQTGWSLVTHDRLLTLRDEKGNVRKIYNRTDWAGVQRVSQIDPPKPPAPPTPPPAPARASKGNALGVPAVRPVLYTEDREEIFKMGFEKDARQPQTVKDAVGRLRARQTVSAPMARDLAAAVRAYNERPDVPEKKRRTNERAASWLDAAAAEIEGRERPELPGRDGVVKTSAKELAHGDTVALVGPDRTVDIVTVRGAKSNTWGVTTLDVEHADGQTETREVLSKASAYLLPDPPEPVEVPPPGDRRELIHPDRLRKGDVVEYGEFRYEVLEAAQRGSWRWDVELQPTWMEDGKRPDSFSLEMQPENGMPGVIRVQRGPGSANDTWDAVMLPENPTEIDGREVKAGDRVQGYSGLGGPLVVGSVTDVDIRTGPAGNPIYWMGIQSDDGQMKSIRLRGSEMVTRLVEADENVDERMRQQRELAAHIASRAEMASALSQYQKVIREKAIKRARAGTGFQNAADIVREMNDGQLFEGALSEPLVRRILPDAGYKDREPLHDRFRPIARDVARRELEAIATSLENSQLLPGEGNYWKALDRVLDTLEKAPQSSPSQWRDAADALAKLAPELGPPDSPKQVPRIPKLPEDADLPARVAAYRKAIGPHFGKRAVTRTLPRTTSLTDLEAGVVPHVETVTEYVPDVSKDGGPGKFAMRHLEILKAAGEDVAQQLGFRTQDRRWEQYGTANRLRREEDKIEDQLLELLKQRRVAPSAKALAELDEKIAKVRERGKEVDNALARLPATRPNVIQREEAMKIISELRGEPMGGDLDYRIVGPEQGDASVGVTINPTEQDKLELASGMKFATDAYPASWMARLRERGEYRLKKTTRGYHDDANRVIALSEDLPNSPQAGKYGEVAVHEVGHGMERAIPGLLEAENAFMWSRTAKGEVGSRHRPKVTDIYAGTRERGWEDDFKSHYSGKDYNGDPFELFTTGIQELTGGGQGYLDEDYQKWLLGVMVLL